MDLEENEVLQRTGPVRGSSLCEVVLQDPTVKQPHRQVLIFVEKEVLEDVEASNSCLPQYVMLHFATQLVLQDLTVKQPHRSFEEKEVLEDVEELGHVEGVQYPLPASDRM